MPCRAATLCSNTLYKFDSTVMVWSNISNTLDGAAPSARSRHGFLHFTDQIFYVFGGETSAGIFTAFMLPIGISLVLIIPKHYQESITQLDLTR